MDDEDLVSALEHIGRQLSRVAHAITPLDAMPAPDNHGGVVGSATEALLSIGQSLDSVASSISEVAEAILVHCGEK